MIPRNDSRFVVGRRLGEGGFGTVYAARDQKLGIDVALKYLHRHNPTAIYHFKREFRNIASISHPNLVALHELFHADDEWYFTMELIDGTPLVSALRKEPGEDQFFALPTETVDHAKQQPMQPAPVHVPTLGDTDVAEVRRVFSQLVDAVRALHRLGLLHRDLKPSNVLVTPAGRAVVLDFGLMTERSRPASSQPVAGTPLYMAPERFYGQTASEASDWYSVGVMLHQTLTGGVPWRDEVEMMTDKLRGEEILAAAAPGAPEDLTTLARELMGRRAAARPDADEILRRLSGSPAPARAIKETPSRAAFEQFVGREEQLTLLRQHLAGVQAGGCAIVQIEGESGIGKTALCERFLGELDDVLVLRGRCYAQESLPYKALDGVLDELSRHLLRLPDSQVSGMLPRRLHELARLFPVLRRVPAVAQARRVEAEAQDELEIRRRGFIGLRQLFERLGAERPLVVYIDDAQWGDLDSAAVLHELLSPPDPPSMMLLLSQRADDRRFADRLAHPCELLSLTPLGDDEARALLSRLAGQGAATQRILEEAGGNPLLVEQLASFAAQQPLPERSGLLAAMIEAKLALLPESWRKVAMVVALAGHPIEAETAFRAVGMEAPDPVCLRRLRADHLLRALNVDGNDLLASHHDAIRQAELAGLDAGERSRLHGALADMLGPTAPPRLRATHLIGAGRSSEAVRHLLLAADEAAAALAFEDAAELLGQALSLSNEEPIRVKYADALAKCGRCIAAAPVFVEAAASAQPQLARDLRRRAFELYYTGGQREEAIAIWRGLLEDVGLNGFPDGGRASLAWDLLQLRLRGTRFAERSEEALDPDARFRIDLLYTASNTMLRRDSLLQVRCAARGLRLALEAGEPNRVAEGLAQVGAILSMIRPNAGRRLVDEARQLARRQGTPRVLGVVELWAGLHDLGCGGWSAALTAADAAVGLFRECPGVTAEIQQAQILGLIVVQQLGRFDDLARRAQEAVAHARATGNHYLEDYLQTPLAIPLLMAGHAADARRLILSSLERIPIGDSTRAGSIIWLCACDLYEGDAAGALERFRRFQSELGAIQMPRHPMLRASNLIESASLTLQARGDLSTVARDIKQMARLNPPHVPGHTALLEAGLAAARGDSTRAIELCRKSVAAFEAANLVPAAMCARRRLGQLLGEGGVEIATADAWMRSRGIADPERWTNCRAPGFP